MQELSLSGQVSIEKTNLGTWEIESLEMWLLAWGIREFYTVGIDHTCTVFQCWAHEKVL